MVGGGVKMRWGERFFYLDGGTIASVERGSGGSRSAYF